MDANLILEKIQETNVALEQSAGTHNALLGRLMAFKELLASMASKDEDSADAQTAAEAVPA